LSTTGQFPEATQNRRQADIGPEKINIRRRRQMEASKELFRGEVRPPLRIAAALNARWRRRTLLH
jgi:hypothetical protein